MPGRAPAVAMAVAVVVVAFAGCLGGSPGASAGGTSTTPAATPASTATTTTASDSCVRDRPSFAARVEKPDAFTRESVKSVALAVEREYARAWLDAENTTFFRLMQHSVSVTETDDGYEVVLEMAAHYEPTNSTIEHVNRPYTAHYAITASSVVRGGVTLVCW